MVFLLVIAAMGIVLFSAALGVIFALLYVSNGLRR